MTFKEICSTDLMLTSFPTLLIAKYFLFSLFFSLFRYSHRILQQHHRCNVPRTCSGWCSQLFPSLLQFKVYATRMPLLHRKTYLFRDVIWNFPCVYVYWKDMKIITTRLQLNVYNLIKSFHATSSLIMKACGSQKPPRLHIKFLLCYSGHEFETIECEFTACVDFISLLQQYWFSKLFCFRCNRFISSSKQSNFTRLGIGLKISA